MVISFCSFHLVMDKDVILGRRVVCFVLSMERFVLEDNALCLDKRFTNSIV